MKRSFLPKHYRYWKSCKNEIVLYETFSKAATKIIRINIMCDCNNTRTIVSSICVLLCNNTFYDADEAGIDLFLVIRKTLMGHFISYTSQGVELP